MSSTRIAIAGCGAVSPAGWGVQALLDTLDAEEPLPSEIDDSQAWPARVRRVPPLKQPLFRDPRLRRASAVARFMAAATFEALGEERVARARAGDLRVGVISTMLCGCVNYSRRFYREVLDDPRTASPIVFPETVFNAPSSHLSALLGSSVVNYTLVGDAAQFLAGIDLAAQWILEGEVDGVVVVAGEEYDWLSAGALNLFARDCVLGEGAGAWYLEADNAPEVELVAVTDPERFASLHGRIDAVGRIMGQLPGEGLLVDSRGRGERHDRAEAFAWNGDRVSPATILGEGLAALASWQCVAAVGLAERDAIVLSAGLTSSAPGFISGGIDFLFLACADGMDDTGSVLCDGRIANPLHGHGVPLRATTGTVFPSMSDSAALKSRIKAVLVEELMLNEEPSEIADDVPLFGNEGMGLDSVDALQLVVALEKHFDLKVEDAEMAKGVLQSVNTICSAIENAPTE